MIPGEKLANIREQNRRQMLRVLAITVVFMLVEIVTGWYTGSLALLADAGHMVTDVGAIILGLIAFWFSGKAATEEKTYGYYRSEILASLINAIVLIGISIFIITEAWHRLKEPITVMSVPVFLVAALGLFINLICLRLLHHGEEKRKHSMNVRAAYLEIFSDALASFGVLVSSTIIFFTGWYRVDTVVSILIGILILPRTWILLTECINILMEGTPEHIDLKQVRESICSVEGVLDVHDIHVWTITSGLDSMSAHVTINKEARLDQVLDMVTKVLQEKFSLNHTTIQIEQASCQTETNRCS